MNDFLLDIEKLGGNVQLNELGFLDWVDFAFTRVQDKDLDVFDNECASHITYISLAGTQISDLGLSKLHPLFNLGELDLAETEISGLGFNSLPFNLLKRLSLKNCKRLLVDGIKHLSNFPNLQKLNVSGSNIDDRLLGEIGKLTHLERLWADGTRISDDGLVDLYNLTHLRWFSVDNTMVSSGGMTKLLGTLPQLNRGLVL